MNTHFLLLLLLPGTLFQMSGVPITVIIYVSFVDILVLFSLQRLNFLFDNCTYVHVIALLMVFVKNALMCIEESHIN